MALSRRRVLRSLAAAAGGALTAALVPGCGRRRGDRSGPRLLNVWTLDLAPRFNAYLQAVMRSWEQQNPGVDVGWTDVPWASVERKLLAAVFARTAPDLVNLNPPFAANLASKGGLLDLAGVLPPDASAGYLAPVWQAGQQDGQQFALPWYLTARITMANRSLLQRSLYEAPPQRWDQVPAYAAALRRRSGRYALFMTVVPDDSAELLETFVQQGVQLLDGERRAAFNSEAGKAAFAFWSSLYRDGLLPREVVSQGYRRAVELYQSGDLAQVATGPDFLRNLQTNAPGIAAVTAPFAPITGASGVANVAVMNLVVPRQSAMAPEAVSFALHLTNASNQLAFAELARVLPSSTAALQQLQQRLQADSGASGSERLVQRARLLSAQTLAQAQVLVPAIPGIKRLQAILYTQLQRAMLSEVSSDQALAEAALQWNRYAEARWP